MGRGWRLGWMGTVAFALSGCGVSDVTGGAPGSAGAGGSNGSEGNQAGEAGEPTMSSEPWAHGERDACMMLREPFSKIEPDAGPSQGCNVHGSDRCDCEGQTCQSGLTCLRVLQLMTAAEPAYSFNDCFSVCATNADCVDGATCEPRQYGVMTCGQPFECHVDADCAREPGGICAPIWGGRGHGGVEFQTGVRCVYSGSCGKTSCDGCSGESTCHSCPWP
jgi:hypothetical protein